MPPQPLCKLQFAQTSKLLDLNNYHDFNELDSYVCGLFGMVQIWANDEFTIDNNFTFTTAKEMAAKQAEGSFKDLLTLKCKAKQMDFQLCYEQNQWSVSFHDHSFENLKEMCLNKIQLFGDVFEFFYLNNNKIIVHNDSSLSQMVCHFSGLPFSERKLFCFSEIKFLTNKLVEMYRLESLRKIYHRNDTFIFECSTDTDNKTVVKVKKGACVNERNDREYVRSWNLNNPYIVKIIGSAFTIQVQDYSYSCYQMPYYQGTLRDILPDQSKIPSYQSMSECTLLGIALKLSNALLYIQEKNLIHCDIRPENIFISNQKPMGTNSIIGVDYDVVLGDFEYAFFVHSLCSGDELFGTPHPAPEVKLTKQHTFESDVYSFGLTLLQMACGRISNKQEEMIDFMNEKYSPDFSRLVQSTLNDQPENRPNITTIYTKLSKIGIGLHGSLLQYVIPSLTRDRDFIIKAMKQNTNFLHCIDPSLLNDTELVKIINPFSTHALLSIETTFDVDVGFKLSTSQEFTELKETYEQMNKGRHVSIGIVGNQNNGKSSFINWLIGEDVFRVGTNNTQTTVGVDFILRQSNNNSQTNMYIDCEGFESLERRDFFKQDITNAIKKNQFSFLTPEQTQTLATDLVSKFNMKLALLLYRICNVLMIYCETDNIGDLSFLDHLSKIGDIRKVEKKPALVLLIRQTFLNSKHLTLKEFSERKDRTIGANMYLFSSVQYFVVPDNFTTGTLRTDMEKITKARSLMINNENYYPSMQYFVERALCPSVNLLAEDNDHLVHANFDPQHIVILRKYVCDSTEHEEKAELLINQLLTMNDRLFDSLSSMKLILDAFHMVNFVEKNEEEPIITLDFDFLQPVISPVNRFFSGYSLYKDKKELKREVDKTLLSLMSHILRVEQLNENLEKSFKILEETFKMSRQDIEDLQYLCFIIHCLQKDQVVEPMNKKHIALKILNLIEIRENLKLLEKYDFSIDATTPQMNIPEGNVGAFILSSLVSILFFYPATILAFSTNTATISTHMFTNFELLDYLVEEYVWSTGRVKKLNDKIKNFLIYKETMDKEYQTMEGRIHSIYNERLIINDRMEKLNIYKQILNIHFDSHSIFRLTSEYKYQLGFKYQDMEKVLLERHLLVLKEIADPNSKLTLSDIEIRLHQLIESFYK